MTDELLPGQDRPPPRWHRPAGFALAAVAVVGVGVLAVRGGGEDRTAAPSPVPTLPRPSVPRPSTLDVAPVVPASTPVGTVVRDAFPGRTVRVRGTHVASTPDGNAATYDLRVGPAALRIDVTPQPDGAGDSYSVDAGTLVVRADLRGRRVTLRFTPPDGFTRRDLASLTTLSKDARLLSAA